jgi:hypothetical protein
MEDCAFSCALSNSEDIAPAVDCPLSGGVSVASLPWNQRVHFCV